MTWRKLLEARGATVFVEISPVWEVLDKEFDAGYGGPEGPEFLAWTTTHVWFPVVYDGAESVGSAPRNPVSEGQEHVGSW